jgi:radical SAM protein with 4Fe4S-binding SPASM domain
MIYPGFIQWYPSLRCNQKCGFCVNQSLTGMNQRQEASEEEAYALANILLQKGIMELDVLGGEPMLVPWMEDFLRYATSACITVHISTNGSLPEIVNSLAKIPTQLLHIGFSLHGFSETHNAVTRSDNFHSVIEGIRRTIGEGKNPIIKSVLTSENRGEICNLILYLVELGVKRYFLLHEDMIGRGDLTGSLSFPDFMRYFSRCRSALEETIDIGFVAASGFSRYGPNANRKCDAGQTKLAILPDGSTFPCNLFLGFREWCLGNFLRDSPESILSHPILERFRTFTGNACRFSDCDHYATCSGGCPAHSYSFDRDIDAPDPRCRHGGYISERKG